MEYTHTPSVHPAARLAPSCVEGARQRVGLLDATRLVMAVEPGEGDSVEKYARLWEGITLDEVHHEILKAKEQCELSP